MTCIVGIAQEGRVWIGSDTQSTAGWDIRPVADDEKVFANGPFLFGICGEPRMGQLLRYGLRVPLRDAEVSDFQYMVTSFVDAIRVCFKAGGWSEAHDTKEKGGFFIVGYRGQLYTIQENYQVMRSTDGLASIGCGENFAYGALHATEHDGRDPEERIHVALEAADRFSAGVSAPFVIKEQS